MPEIYCLMVGHGNLTDGMRTLLFLRAREMYARKDEVSRVITDDLEACVRSEFKIGILGDIAGPIFSADIDSVWGRATVRYIVRTTDIEDVDPDDFHWVHGDQRARWN